jgi:hypothetical protein
LISLAHDVDPDITRNRLRRLEHLTKLFLKYDEIGMRKLAPIATVHGRAPGRVDFDRRAIVIVLVGLATA